MDEARSRIDTLIMEEEELKKIEASDKEKSCMCENHQYGNGELRIVTGAFFIAKMKD